MIYRILLLCCLASTVWAADVDLRVLELPADTIPEVPNVVNDDTACTYTDDIRLESIGDVLAKIKQGKKIKPVAVTLETFLELNQNIVKALGKNLVVLKKKTCKVLPIIDGKAIVPFKADFFELFGFIETAVENNDAEKLTFIKENIRVNPLSVEDLLTLVSYVDYDKKQLKLIAKTLGVKGKRSNGQVRLHMLAIYQKLGGKAKNRTEKLYFHERLRRIKPTFFTATSNSNNIRKVRAGEFIQLFNRMGLKVINVGEDEARVKEIKGIED